MDVETWTSLTPETAASVGRRRNRTPRGNSFRASIVGLLYKRGSWREDIRPVWTVMVTETGATPFVIANLRSGYKFHRGNNHSQQAEYLKSAGHVILTQNRGDYDVSMVFEPSLFRLDPGPVRGEEAAQFILIPDRGWSDKCGWGPEVLVKAKADIAEKDYPDDLGHYAADVKQILEGSTMNTLARAGLMVAYLDRRTRCPILPDPGFHLWLYATFKATGRLIIPGESRRGTETWEHFIDPRLPYGKPVVFESTQDDIETILGNLTAAWLE